MPSGETTGPAGCHQGDLTGRMSGTVIRAVAAHEVVDFLTVLGRAYGITVDDRYVAAWDGAFDHERNVALFDGGRLIGTATAGLVDLTTPGPVVVPAICTGNLTVLPGTAGPGAALRVFAHQCRQHRAAGFGVLVFSVTSAMRMVHLRIGSAPASGYAPLTLTADRVGAVPAGLETVPASDPVLGEVHHGLAARTTGMIVRDPAWMTTVRRINAMDRVPVAWTHTSGGRVDGYALWHREGSARIVVEELATEEPAAARNLVRGLLAATGLPVELRYWRIDDPLRWCLGTDTMFTRDGQRDALWVRVVDVPRALCDRRYLAGGALTLQVHDPFLPEVTDVYALEVTAEGAASCVPVPQARRADVTLPVGALAAAYLGGTSVWTLIESGRIRPESARAARLMAGMFATDRLPWSGSER